MSALLLHGIVEAGSPIPEEAGPHDRCVAGGLTGLATPLPAGLLEDREGARTVTAGLAHDALLGAYAARVPVLPVRFGTAFSGRAAVLSELCAEADRYRTALARLGRSREYGIALCLDPASTRPGMATPGPTAAADGRSFLRRRGAERRDRRQEVEARQAFVAALPGLLASHVAACHPTSRRAEGRLGDYAVLVAAGAEGRFTEAVDMLRPNARRCGLHIRLGGPWPAYSFAEDASGV